MTADPLVQHLGDISRWFDHRADMESEPECKQSHRDDAQAVREAATRIEALKAEVVDDIALIDMIAQTIRAVDGRHEMGAAALAEHIAAAILASGAPIADEIKDGR